MKWREQRIASELSARRLSSFAASKYAITWVMLGAAPAFALSLGAERVESYLGQPLRVSYPIVASGNESFDEKCFKVVPINRNDGIPSLLQATLSVDAARRQLTVRGRGFADEPAIRFAIDVGCEVPLRREYIVLLDPAPTIAPPVLAATEPVVRPAAVTSSGETGADSAAAKLTPAPQRSTTTNNSKRDVRSAAAPRAASSANAKAERSRAASATPNTPRKATSDRLTVQGGASSSGAEIGDAALSALAVPRLRISSDIPVFSTVITQTGANTTDELAAAIAKERRARLLATPIDEDIAPRLEADLVVAKRRLAEAQAQLSAANGAAPQTSASPPSTPSTTPAPSAAGKPAAAKAPTSNEADSLLAWWMLAPLALLIGLLAWLLSRRRAAKKLDAAFSSDSAAVTVVTESVDGEAHDDNVHVSTLAKKSAAVGIATPPAAKAPLPRPTSAQAEKAAAEQLASPLFQLSDTEASVDVSELSHVTDEAQVFVDLGLNDQAITVLHEHITHHSAERPSPAVWLMLFDLLRRTNRRADYDALVPQFRSHFNGRMPDWESYGTELALDDGLEAFPHLVARIERDWGSPDARKFLEELLYDNRGGSRLGFSLAAYRDLLLLMQIHDHLAAHGQLGGNNTRESRGADDDDGTPKWDLALDIVEPAKPGELDAFLRAK